MLVALPLICFALLYRLARPLGCWRRRLLMSMTAWGLAGVVITEALGAFGLLRRGPLALAWGLLGVALSALQWRVRRANPELPPHEAPSRAVKAMMAGLAIGVLLLLVLGIVAAPNNADSMTYHMVRVVHWMQEASVDDFPTHFPPQVYPPPFAEFCILHLQILSGGDRLANLVQWAAMVGSLAGVSYLAGLLGVGLRGQVLAAIVAFSIPMGILQASSTQNNHVVALWFVGLTVWGVEALAAQDARQRRLFLAAAAVCLGLALLTKGTAFIFALPFCAWFALALIHKLGRRALLPMLCVAAIVCAINAGHFMRNYASCGSALVLSQDRQAGGTPMRYSNDDFAPRAILSNIIRNLALQIAPAGRGAGPLSRMVRQIHRWIGVDPDDPRTTFGGYRFSIPAGWRDEDYAASPLHLLFAVAALGFCCFTTRKLRPPTRAYAITVAGAFLAFCALLRWQPFHSRLHLPLFVLSAPLIAVAVEKTWPRRGAVAVSTLLLLCSAVWIFGNEERPMLGGASVFVTSREDQYFRNDSLIRQPYDQAAAQIHARHWTRVGIGGFCWEYPFWLLLKGPDPGIRIEHVGVHNYTAALQSKPYFRDFAPQAVVTFDSSAGGVRARFDVPPAQPPATSP